MESAPITETHLDLIGADLAASRGGKFEVRRIIEIVQNRPRCHGAAQTRRCGARRGPRVRHPRAALVAVDGATITELSPDVAHGIHVKPAA